jgi:hypothetical protein
MNTYYNINIWDKYTLALANTRRYDILTRIISDVKRTIII